jgi:hypothetical protein
MAKELENRQAQIRTFEFTSSFHLLTTPRESLSDDEARRIRVERSVISYVDGVISGKPRVLFTFEVDLTDFAEGLGGVRGLESKLDKLSQDYIDSLANSPEI